MIATIRAIDENVEEDVTFDVGPFLVRGHVHSLFWFSVGQSCDIDIGLFVLDDFDVKIDSRPPGFYYPDDGFKCDVVGYIRDNALFVGDVRIEDDYLINYEYLSGENICVKVDRLDISIEKVYEV